MVERGPFRTKEVCSPGGSVAEAAWNVSGPLVLPRAHVIGPPEVMVQGGEQEGEDVPALVPAKTTWQVVGEQEMGPPPLFLTETEMAPGESA